MTPGAARDVEADEVFVVLSGSATIEFEDGREVLVQPGDVVTLVQGQRTLWTVTEPLRKVYVAAVGPSGAQASAWCRRMRHEPGLGTPLDAEQCRHGVGDESHR